MKTTTVGATCNALHSVFARYGLPAQIVSDNGPPFQSVEYSEFLQQNGIQRILVSSYHPSSNGLAERFVQTFKYALESSVADPAYTPQQQITRFLLSYRSTPHATTGSSPARLFLGRDLSTCLSLTRPDLASCVACQQGKMKSNHDKHAKFQDVAVGDTWHCWHCWHVTIYPVASGNLVQWYSRPHPIPTVFSNKMVRLGGDTLMTFFWTVQVQEPLKQRKHPLREIFKITLEKQTAPLQKIVNQRIHPLLLPLLVLNYANLNAPQNHLRGWLKNFEWTLLCSFEHC